MFIYSIYDKKAECFRTQFFASSDAEANRQLYRAANDSRTDINMFPNDFALYCNGKFDVNSGVVSGLSPIKFICDASSLISIDNKE